LLTKVCTLGGMGGDLDTEAATEPCQLICLCRHSRRSDVRSREENTITSVHIPIHIQREQGLAHALQEQGVSYLQHLGNSPLVFKPERGFISCC